MFVLLLLFTPALSASTAITSTTFTFQSESTHTGAVKQSEIDGFGIEVTSSSVHTLSFDLQVLEGDADLGICYRTPLKFY
jgi:hypothetical protein